MQNMGFITGMYEVRRVRKTKKKDFKDRKAYIRDWQMRISHLLMINDEIMGRTN